VAFSAVSIQQEHSGNSFGGRIFIPQNSLIFADNIKAPQGFPSGAL